MEPQIGTRFERLVITRIFRKPRGKQTYLHVEYHCDCGNDRSAAWYDVQSGKVKSCGCMKRERIIFQNTKHGGRNTRLYFVWQDMRRRCEDSTRKQFPDYGGRGITVCADWHTFEIFREWALSHSYSDSLTIDRIDVNGNYSPDNCRFITIQMQQRNRRTSHPLTAFGETKTIRDWIDDPRCLVSYSTLSQRIVKLNWDAERAISTP